MAIVLNTLGAFYQKQGKSEQASAYLQESFVIHEELTNMSIGGLTTLLVSVLIALGRREVAQEYCRRALIIAPDDRRVLASQHRVLQRIEDEEALRENLKIREKQRDRRQIGVLLNKLGRIYRKQRRLTEAEEALQRSLAIGEELQDQRHIGMVLNTLGGVYQAQGRLTEAKEVLRWALVICEQQVGLEQSYVRMIRENYGALLEHLAGSTEEPDHIAEERSS